MGFLPLAVRPLPISQPSLPSSGLGVGSLTVARNNIVPFRPSLPSATPKLPPSVPRFAPKVAGVGATVASESFLAKASSIISTAANVLMAMSIAAELTEKYLAPKWFEFLERTTGFRFHGVSERNVVLPPGRYTLEAQGSFIFENRTWRDRDYNWFIDYRITNPRHQRQQVDWNSSGVLVAYRISNEEFPLTPGVKKQLYGADYTIGFVFSNGEQIEFNFEPRINPDDLGPYYTYSWCISKQWNLLLKVIESNNPQVKPNAELKYQPASPDKTRTAKLTTTDQKVGTTQRVKLPVSIPEIQFPQVPRLPKETTKPPTKVSVPDSPLVLRPTPVPASVPSFLSAPDVAPELEPIRDLIIRVLEKECPPPCPPCPDKEKQDDDGQDQSEDRMDTFPLFWVEKDSEGGLQLAFGTFPGKVPSAITDKVKWTAETLKTLGVHPVVAGTPEDENPHKVPLGAHLKVVWCPADGTTGGYYHLRMPHWQLSFNQTLNLPWDTLRWHKGTRHELQIKFSSGKKTVFYGSNLDNLEQIFNFLLQGIEPGVTFELTKVIGSAATRELTLKVKKLELWTNKAGHPEWWSWYPPL